MQLQLASPAGLNRGCTYGLFADLQGKEALLLCLRGFAITQSVNLVGSVYNEGAGSEQFGCETQCAWRPGVTLLGLLSFRDPGCNALMCC